MFTIKYRQADGSDFISGPYESVENVRDEENPRYWVVRGLNGPDGHTYQCGPNMQLPESDQQPIVWVMNEQGATVATYLL